MPAGRGPRTKKRARVDHVPGERRLLEREVREVMSIDVQTIRHETSIAEASRRLVELRVHGAPVIDSDGRLVGLVSQSDLLAWHTEQLAGGRSAGPQPNGAVRDVMTPFAHAVQPDTLVSTAAALMIKRRIHRLMVVDRDLAPVGIVTAFDLLSTVPGVKNRLASVGPPQH